MLALIPYMNWLKACGSDWFIVLCEPIFDVHSVSGVPDKCHYFFDISLQVKKKAPHMEVISVHPSLSDFDIFLVWEIHGKSPASSDF
jgi:hypothetical protein